MKRVLLDADHAVVVPSPSWPWTEMVAEMRYEVRQASSVLTQWMLARTCQEEYVLWRKDVYRPVPPDLLATHNEEHHLIRFQALRAATCGAGYLYYDILERAMARGTPAQFRDFREAWLGAIARYSAFVGDAFLNRNLKLLKWLHAESYPLSTLFAERGQQTASRELLDFGRQTTRVRTVLENAVRDDGNHAYGTTFYCIGSSGSIPLAKWTFRFLYPSTFNYDGFNLIRIRLTMGALERCQLKFLDWLHDHHRYEDRGLWLWLTPRTASWNVACLDWLHARGRLPATKAIVSSRVRNAWAGDETLVTLALPTALRRRPRDEPVAPRPRLLDSSRARALRDDVGGDALVGLVL